LLDKYIWDTVLQLTCSVAENTLSNVIWIL